MSIDLRTRYLGLELRSPLVASASPLTAKPEVAQILEASGAGAIVLPSLFEEEIEAEQLGLNAGLEQGSEHYAEALHYYPAMPDLLDAGERYLANLTEIRSRVSMPLIASLNATSTGGWVDYARSMVEAGADAIELNIYHLAADPSLSAADVEEADLSIVAAVRAAVAVPLAVKLSPHYTALASFVARVVAAGANGVVLFNRFYQPDLDLDTFDVVPNHELSRPADARQALRWIGILRAQLGPDVSLAATSGVWSGTDALKLIAVGADVAMTTSSLLQRGPTHLATMATELHDWLLEHEYESVRQLCGSASSASVADPSAYERANYMRNLRSWSSPPELEPWTPSGRAVTVQQPMSVRVAESGDAR